MKRLLCLLLCAAAGGCERREREPVPPARPEKAPVPEVVALRLSSAASARAQAAGILAEDRRLEEHERLLAEALAADPREALRWLLGLEDKALAAVLLDQALEAWAEIDAPAAGAHVTALPESDYRTMLAGELGAAWAARDGAAATAWAAGLGDQEAREEALRGALAKVVETDPRRAAELALRTTREGDRAATLERVLETWWAGDAAAAEAWARGLADPRERELAERLVAARRETRDEAGAGK